MDNKNQEQPPAGARDAVADAVREIAREMASRAMSKRNAFELLADSLQARHHDRDAGMRHAYDQAARSFGELAYQVADHFSIPEREYSQATQPAATGAGETLMKCICTLEGQGCTNRCDRGQLSPLPAMKVTLATSTAATGMGESEIRRVIHELRTYDPIADEYKGAHIHGVWARELESALAAQPAPVWTKEEIADVDLRADGLYHRIHCAAQPAPVALDDAASDIPAWHLIEVAERLGAVKESSDDEMWWTLNLTTFYAIEKELHAAVNAHQYAQCAQPAPVVGGVKAVVPDGYELVWKPTLTDMRERIAVESMAVHGDSVWYWQGDGYDFPESMTCPVIMSASTIRVLLARRASILRNAAAVLHMWEGEPDETGYMGSFDDAESILEILAQRAEIDAPLLSARPAESVIGDVDGVARLLADAAGHGMREKCEPLARQIVELLSARPGGDDTKRLDYIERTFAGCSNQERYLPLRMLWGKGANGRTLREACDKYMARDAAHPAQAGGEVES